MAHAGTAEKTTDFLTWAEKAFSAEAIEDILLNARKACEALTKLSIIDHYGAEIGHSVIMGTTRPHTTTGALVPSSTNRPLDLAGLISVTCAEYSANIDATIIKNRTERGRVKNYLDTIRINGNPAAHDTSLSLTLGDARLVQFALAKLVNWHMIEIKKELLPPILAGFISSIEGEYASPNRDDAYEDVRGFQIVQICYPKHKVSVQLKCNEPGRRIGYEYITIEIAASVTLGYLFVKNKINIVATLQHFLDRYATQELASLTICTPRVFNRKGDSVERLVHIKDKFIDLAPLQLRRKVEFFFIDDFVWEKCLAQTSNALANTGAIEQHFVDQELFDYPSDGSEPTKLGPSLTYVTSFVTNPLSVGNVRSPIRVVLGRAGVGKTTFAEQLTAKINSLPKKRAILISSTDLRHASPDKVVKSLTDLYRLYVNVNNLPISETMDSETFEVSFSCGNIAIIIDGLDEIQSMLGNRFDLRAFLNSITDLDSSFLCSNLIITSRDYHASKYLSVEITTYQLLGFSEELVWEYLRRRLSSDNARTAHARLEEFDIQDKNRHTPLFVSLVCDLLERDEIVHESLLQQEGGRYYLLDNPLDRLIFQLLEREIGKQSLDMSCDDYFELVAEMVIRSKGIMSKTELNEYIKICVPKAQAASPNHSDMYPQFYVSPLFSYNHVNDAFIGKYDFINTWIKTRYLFDCIRRNTTDEHVTDLFVDCHDGTDAIIQEFVTAKPFSHAEILTKLSPMLFSLIRQADSSSDIRKFNTLERAISGLLYLALSTNSKHNRGEYTKDLVTLYGSTTFRRMCIFGRFFPLDFSDIKVVDGLFDKYDMFEKCRFPNDKQVFCKTRFRGIDMKIGATLNDTLFDDDCDLNEELERAFKGGLATGSVLWAQVRTNLHRILKVGFRNGGFVWKSESVYKVVSLKGAKSLAVYLQWLALAGVLEKRPSESEDGQGYIVALPFRDAAKNLIANNLVKPELEVIINKILREYHDL